MTDHDDTYAQEQIDRGSSREDDESAGEVIYLALLDMGYPNRGDVAECLAEARRYIDAHRDGVFGRCKATIGGGVYRCRLCRAHSGPHAAYEDFNVLSVHWGNMEGDR